MTYTIWLRVTFIWTPVLSTTPCMPIVDCSNICIMLKYEKCYAHTLRPSYTTWKCEPLSVRYKSVMYILMFKINSNVSRKSPENVVIKYRYKTTNIFCASSYIIIILSGKSFPLIQSIEHTWLCVMSSSKTWIHLLLIAIATARV